METNSSLIVDDEEQMREILSRYLTLKGFRIETAVNGVDGLNKFTSRPCDLLLTDIQMPLMDGLVLSNEIKKIQPETAVIIITGDAHLALQARSISDFVLIKPFGLAELNGKLQSCVRKQAQPMRSHIEFRRSQRIRHISIICLQDGQSYPYYGLMYNVNQSGLYYQTINETLPGQSLHVQIEDLPPGYDQNSFTANVVWYERLSDNSDFRYGMGIKYR